MNDLKKCCTCNMLLSITNFCKNNSTKDKLSKRCKVCVKLRSKSRSIYNKKYREKNIVRLNDNDKQYYLLNKETLSIRKKTHYQDNKIEYVIRAHNYYKNNSKKIKDKVKDYNNTIYKKQRILNVRKRRALKKNAFVQHFKHEEIINKYGDKCFYCLIGKFEHIDHYIPLSKNGEHTLENIRPSCASCNMSKHDKLPLDFIKNREL